MGFTLLFPKSVWNAHSPPPPPPPPPILSSCPITPSPQSSYSQRHTPDPPRSPTHCKIPLYRFHHGGPRRALRGESMNDITLEQPCLRVGCGMCWRWRGWEMRGLHVPMFEGEMGHGFAGAGRDCKEGEEEGVKVSVIDPRILDGRWKGARSADLTTIPPFQPPRGDDAYVLRNDWDDDAKAFNLTPVDKPTLPTFTPYPITPSSPTGFHASRKDIQWPYGYNYAPPTPSSYHVFPGPPPSNPTGLHEDNMITEKWNKVRTEKGRARSLYKRRCSARQKLTPEERKAKKREYDRARRAGRKIQRCGGGV